MLTISWNKLKNPNSFLLLNISQILFYASHVENKTLYKGEEVDYRYSAFIKKYYNGDLVDVEHREDEGNSLMLLEKT